MTETSPRYGYVCGMGHSVAIKDDGDTVALGAAKPPAPCIIWSAQD
jgi:hypothetical protein